MKHKQIKDLISKLQTEKQARETAKQLRLWAKREIEKREKKDDFRYQELFK